MGLGVARCFSSFTAMQGAGLVVSPSEYPWIDTTAAYNWFLANCDKLVVSITMPSFQLSNSLISQYATIHLRMQVNSGQIKAYYELAPIPDIPGNVSQLQNISGVELDIISIPEALSLGLMDSADASAAVSNKRIAVVKEARFYKNNELLLSFDRKQVCASPSRYWVYYPNYVREDIQWPCYRYEGLPIYPSIITSFAFIKQNAQWSASWSNADIEANYSAPISYNVANMQYRQFNPAVSGSLGFKPAELVFTKCDAPPSSFIGCSVAVYLFTRISNSNHIVVDQNSLNYIVRSFLPNKRTTLFFDLNYPISPSKLVEMTHDPFSSFTYDLIEGTVINPEPNTTYITGSCTVSVTQ